MGYLVDVHFCVYRRGAIATWVLVEHWQLWMHSNSHADSHTVIWNSLHSYVVPLYGIWISLLFLKRRYWHQRNGKITNTSFLPHFLPHSDGPNTFCLRNSLYVKKKKVTKDSNSFCFWEFCLPWRSSEFCWNGSFAFVNIC